MTDRDKLIKAMKCCAEMNCGPECPYVPIGGCRAKVLQDAIDLLREQEATEYVDDGLDSVNGELAIRYKCKFCGQTMTCEFEKSPEKLITYCIRCGRKVNWYA